MEPTDITEDILYCKYNLDIQSRSLYYNIKLSLHRLERSVGYSTLSRASRALLRRDIYNFRCSLHPRNGKMLTMDAAIDKLANLDNTFHERLEEESDAVVEEAAGKREDVEQNVRETQVQ